MSRKMTKDELDEQFELFLKESVSDDSVDLGTVEKQIDGKDKGQKPAPKPTVSWFDEDDDRAKVKHRFLKAPKRQSENNAEVDCPQPVPKPRATALVQCDTTSSHHLEAPREKEAMSPDNEPQGDSDESDVGSGRSFLKSLRKSQTIQEEDESLDQKPREKAQRGDSSHTPDVSHTQALSSGRSVDSLGGADMLGVDTLEEAEEKERFFADLEAEASSTIDYSKLNRDLDSNTSTERKQTEEVSGLAEKKNSRESPGSEHYSDDFEEEDDEKEPEHVTKPKISPILAKVSLYDSLDDTREEEKKKLWTASLDKAQSCAQSGGSDLEALHEALQIHMVQDSEELNRTFTSTTKPDRPQTPPSPQSPPHLRPASTNESDLPTAEELMKPIRPEEDALRDFTLHPVSVLDQTKRPEAEDQPETFPASNQRKPGDLEAETNSLSGWPTGADLLPALEPPLNLGQTWSIHEELKRLMQENDSPPVQTNRAKKQTSGLTGSFQSHFKRPTAVTVQGRTLDSRTTATSRPSSVPGPSAVQFKSKTTKPSVSQARGPKIRSGPEKTRISPSLQHAERGADGGDLVASVQSLVSVLQQQVNTKHNEPAATLGQLSPPRPTEDLYALDKLKAQLLTKEKLIEKLQHDSEELNSIKKQNYVLQSKLRGAEEAIQRNRGTGGTDSTHQEKLQQMDKEMKEQEILIKGYQQENERLYQQMKAQQGRSKANEDAMFQENQRLLSELAHTREQLNKAQKPVSNLCSMDHSQRITQLLDQISGFQKREQRQSEEIQNLKQEKLCLEVDLQLLKDQRDQTRDTDQNHMHTQDRSQQTSDQVQVPDPATSVSGEGMCSPPPAEKRLREEVSELKKRLKWFAENQELLDRDAARLRAATAEILQLKEQVEKLKTEVSKRKSEQQMKARERSADGKRTRDLERQVKELEHILRSRNPNSLPALIFAAANAQESPSSPPGRTTVLLERRVQRLEAELEAHDEQAKRTLRAVEQQFQAVRMRYEQQISELEHQQEQKHQKEGGSDQSLAQSLREELKRERDEHKLKLTTLQNQLDSAHQQLKVKSRSSPNRHQRQAEAAFGLRIERLNQELSTKSRTIQDLTRTVERLQRERRSTLSVPVLKVETKATEMKRAHAPSKMAYGPLESDTEVFPALSACDKTYQPTVFTDAHISEVLQENEALRQKLQQIQSNSEREKDDLQAALTKAQEQLNRLQVEHSQQLTSAQAQSLREQAELRSAFALEHSESVVAQLTSQNHTQQILVQHLQEQLAEAQSWREALRVSRTKEEALQKQLSRLLEDLKEARDNQSPEVKLLRSLERKVQHMETRHQLRDRELQQVIGGGFPEVDLHSEVQRWKRAAQEKTRELDCFRLELDSILDIIRHLQKQGVVLPVPSPQIAALPTR